MSVTHIDLLRHGEAEGGAIYRGRRDDPLTETGWRQMAGAVEPPPIAWDCIVTSPLSRCHAFAQHLAAQLDIPLLVEERFREIDFGDWEGRSTEALMAEAGSRLRRYYDDPWAHTPPNGEPLADFQRRIEAAWQALIQLHCGRSLLLISHGGVMRMILRRVLALPRESLFKLQIPHACLSRIRIDGEGPEAYASLVCHNSRYLEGS